MTTLTCDHCDSEIDVAKDPRCVVYDPSGATDVICKNCKALAFVRWRKDTMTGDSPVILGEQLREAYRKSCDSGEL